MTATSDKLRRALPLLASIGSGVLIFTATADIDWWPLAWIALVPLLWAIDGAPTRRRAGLYAWITGLVANVGGFYWIVGLLERFGQFPWPIAVLGLLLLASYQGVVYWLFGLAVRGIRRARAERPLPMIVVAPIALVCFELLVPFIFPWYLAITQAWHPLVIQIADLAGPVGVSAVLAFTAGAIFDLAKQRGRARLRTGAIAVGVVAMVLGYGGLRLSQVRGQREAAPKLRVGVVQPNIAFNQKGNRDLAFDQLRALQDKSAELERDGAQLILWPESSFPFALPRAATRDLETGSPFRIRRGFSAPLIFGAITRDGRDSGLLPHNSALLLAGEELVARFDKVFLLAFGEYIPMGDSLPWLASLMPPAAGSFEPGKELVTFPLVHDGSVYRVGPMICYEDILPTFGRKLGDKHPHLLVNLTNDAWFGDTAEPWQHMALSVFRAVEVRTDLVRAVNTGVSSLIAADGTVVHETYAVDPEFEPRGTDGFAGDAVLLEGGHTLYTKVGDLFGWLCVLATFALWQVWPRVGAGKRKGKTNARA